MQWLDRLRADHAALSPADADHWFWRQRAIVLRLPDWLVGTSVISSLAFGVWCIVYQRGVWNPMRSFLDPIGAAVTTVVLSVYPTFFALRLIAAFVKPRPSSELPVATVETR